MRSHLLCMGSKNSEKPLSSHMASISSICRPPRTDIEGDATPGGLCAPAHGRRRQEPAVHILRPRSLYATFKEGSGVGWCSGQPVPCGGIHSRESVGSDPVLAPALEFCVWRSRFALPDYITARNQGDRGLPEPSRARASSPAGFHRVRQSNPGLCRKYVYPRVPVPVPVPVSRPSAARSRLGISAR